MIDYRYIEAFLAVVNTNSLSKAAESLYVSQSSISKWICQLEEEIGVELIVRHKGQRSIELTASGKELVPLAEEWMNLHGQIIGMKEHNRTSIRIVSVDSLNNTLMPPIYQELLRTDPELELSVLTGQSPDIYSMVERKQYDVGIVTVELHSPSLIVTPLLTEPFELLLYSERRWTHPRRSLRTRWMCARISIFRADILCGSGMSTGSTLPKAIFGSIRRLRQECSSARKDFGRSYR